MRHFNPLRVLARSARWQILYSRTKELSGINLFDNITDLTPIQLAFLQWLDIYNSLEVDLATKEKCLSREVIEDDYRTDAYLLHRSNKNKEDKSKQPQSGYEAPLDVPSVMFK